MRIAIVGGGFAGLTIGLLLARSGHEVVALERDDLPLADDPEPAAAHAFRAGAPQIVQAHVFRPLLRNLLLEHLPDVYAAVRDVGGVERTLTEQMPDTIVDRAPAQGDERLTLLLMRRSSLDLAVLRVARKQRRLTVLGGQKVIGLLAVPGPPPVVTGVRTANGDVPADLVLDASGRRSDIDDWLTAVGATRTRVEFRECGTSYYTRYLRLRDSASAFQRGGGVLGGPMAFFTALLFLGDHDTAQLALAPLVEDAPLRLLRDAGRFSAVARTIPPIASVLESADPISPIFPMAGLHNTFRRLIVDGRPVAYGLLAVGDSVCTTNPTFGRGLALALRGAVDTVHLIGTLWPDLDGLVRAADEQALGAIYPWFAQQAEIDEQILAQRRARILGGTPPTPPAAQSGTRISFLDLTRAARADPMVFRARCRLQGMIEEPDRVLSDPALRDAVRSTLATLSADARPDQGPEREDLLRLLRAGGDDLRGGSC